MSCTIYKTTNFTPNQGLSASDGSGGGTTTVAYAQAMVAGTTYEMRLRRDLMAYTCDVLAAAGNATQGQTTAVDHTPSSAGFYAGGNPTPPTLHAHWMMIVGNP
jgi:hypothetical protein